MHKAHFLMDFVRKSIKNDASESRHLITGAFFAIFIFAANRVLQREFNEKLLHNWTILQHPLARLEKTNACAFTIRKKNHCNRSFLIGCNFSVRKKQCSFDFDQRKKKLSKKCRKCDEKWKKGRKNYKRE